MNDEAPLPSEQTAPPVRRRAGRPPNARLQRAQPRGAVEREDPREEVVTKRLQRTHRRTVNALTFDKKLIPKGMSYEWKAEKVHGEAQPDHMSNLQENHWKAVPASRHPSLMPEGQRDGGIRRGGLLLMERPDYLTQEARQEDFTIAREQVQLKEDQLGHTPAGTLTRKHGSAGARVGHGIDGAFVVEKE